MAGFTLPEPELGLEKRKQILSVALMIEGLTSGFVAALLGIAETESSRTLGNKSSALSFNQKVDLLIDLGALSAETRAKFSSFMELRNQFMHNIEADTYERCYGFMQGKEAYIFKTYPQDQTKSKEEQLEKASLALATDVFQLTLELTKVLKNRVLEEATQRVHRQSTVAFQEAITEAEQVLNGLAEEYITQGNKFNLEQLRNLGSTVANVVVQSWRKHMEEINQREKELDSPKGIGP